jgi:putative ATP-dependent endonuclease of OLD family
MKLARLTVCNFQSFGEAPTSVDLSGVTFLIGPNGAGKTALMHALCRMFGADRNLRRVRRSDFHAPSGGQRATSLWLQADFEVPEAADENAVHPAVPSFFAHMWLPSSDGPPVFRIRLTAIITADEEIVEKIQHVVRIDEHDQPITPLDMSPTDRNSIQVHYLPARRDPAEQLSYAASTLLGRALRSADFTDAAAVVDGLVGQINAELTNHGAINEAQQALEDAWATVYSGDYLSDATISFGASDIEAVLRLITLSFTPSPGDDTVDLSRLSDGQKSLMYVAIVMAMGQIGRRVLAGQTKAFKPDQMHPAIFTLLAVEEPENSLSPHYVGRIIQALRALAQEEDSQAVLATHAPALLRRVDPSAIRYLRLNSSRESTVRRVHLPEDQGDAFKYVREAVHAFPELYFARLVILGEGDSEEIVLPRMLAAAGIVEDEASVVVAPLGGRHVNHFWRLLNGLSIPHVTLLDLDVGRYQGGWGRIKYAASQLRHHIEDALPGVDLATMAKWDSGANIESATREGNWLHLLEQNNVFFSRPLDLDLLMLSHYPLAYGVEDVSVLAEPDGATTEAVLGKGNPDSRALLEPSDTRFFSDYLWLFKRASKPAAHLSALSALTDAELRAGTPTVLSRMFERIGRMLGDIPA